MRRRSTWRTFVLGAAGVLFAACNPSSPSAGTPGGTMPIATADGAPDSPPPASADGAVDDASPPSDDVTSRDAAGTPPPPTDAAALDSQASDGLGGEASPNAPSPESGPPAGPSRCDATRLDAGRAWMSAGRIGSVPPSGFGRFGGISVDELSIAWTTATGAVYVADRAARAGAFGTPSAVAAASTSDRAALAPSGMVLFTVSADRGGFVAFSRTSVGSAWSASAALQFVNVNAMAAADGGGQFSEPVLGADGSSFFYLLAPPGAPPALYESTWDPQQHAWTTGVSLYGPEFTSSATLRRRATGASSDGRTLFFFDETLGQERAAWRDTPTSPFAWFVSIPGISEAAPNYLCDTLYFQGTDSGGTGAFVAQ